MKVNAYIATNPLVRIVGQVVVPAPASSAGRVGRQNSSRGGPQRPDQKLNGPRQFVGERGRVRVAGVLMENQPLNTSAKTVPARRVSHFVLGIES